MSAPEVLRLPTVAEQTAELAAVLAACARSNERSPDPADPSAGARYQEAGRLVARAALTLLPEDPETPAGA